MQQRRMNGYITRAMIDLMCIVACAMSVCSRYWLAAALLAVIFAVRLLINAGRHDALLTSQMRRKEAQKKYEEMEDVA